MLVLLEAMVLKVLLQVFQQFQVQAVVMVLVIILHLDRVVLEDLGVVLLEVNLVEEQEILHPLVHLKVILVEIHQQLLVLLHQLVVAEQVEMVEILHLRVKGDLEEQV